MQSRSAKPLVICADDYAFSEGVSLAVTELARAGCITATSAMVLSPRWPGDAALLSGLRGSIDVGLHLDWTSPFAAAAGHGISLPLAMLRSITGGYRAAAVTAEVERQLDAFELHWKAAPDHVDGHQHVHQFAGIREPLLELLDRRYGIGNGPYLRISKPLRGAMGAKGWVIRAMGADALRKQLDARHRPSSCALTGLYPFNGTPDDYARRVDGWLRAAPAGAILMCHPGAAADPGDPIAAARLREFDYWRSPAASEAMARANAIPARGPARSPAARAPDRSAAA